MQHFLKNEAAAVSVDWVFLTAGAFVLGFGSLGLVSGGLLSLSREAAATMDGDAIMAIAELGPRFDLSAYAYLSDSRGTPGWQNIVTGFDRAEDFYGWLLSDYANALDAQNDFATRAVLADDYAITFAAAVEKGIDLDGFANPIELRDALALEFEL